MLLQIAQIILLENSIKNEKGKLWKEYNYSKKEIQKQVPKEKIIIYAIFSCSYLRNDTFMN
jgi:hypothetical protein